MLEHYLAMADQMVKQYIDPSLDFQLLISKVLGIGIIFASVFLKVPQIQKLISSRDSTGLSPVSIILETVVFTISILTSVLLAYPFSTYGESVFILAQNIIVVYLVFHYSKRVNVQFWAGVIVYLAAIAGVLQFADRKLLMLLQSLNIVISIVSKIPQIFAIFRLKSVGQLSFITTFLQFAGSIARMFTSYKEIPDPIVLIGYGISASLTLILVLQFLMYWNSTPKRIPSGATKKKVQ
ncbi:hypothetical protein SAMD00019534_065070 [Acytostelium subglobosum LB1]|uniref:hypothetical protein n=1 Tax=Acytostelium subglobosum LB1 TaxID=1410327 RepID=UPI000644FF87|nr:hypothetical protein SAMD00019534_065070 [Acytostelium subglobosum LB1]GAM23332.1 hypothetical protein SAMD00019534_065070 [Acytostelium subglobosum LB1]|eukprot:XP_012753781.1 hypothetical protein SAMD00019534_065070 [Acytostelium subglobosum LB1]